MALLLCYRIPPVECAIYAHGRLEIEEGMTLLLCYRIPPVKCTMLMGDYRLRKVWLYYYVTVFLQLSALSMLMGDYRLGKS